MFDKLVVLYVSKMETAPDDYAYHYEVDVRIAWLESRLGPIVSALAYDEAYNWMMTVLYA